MKALHLIRTISLLAIQAILCGMGASAQALVVTIKVDSVSCEGASDATAYVESVLNGTPPYTYSWFKGATPLAETSDTLRNIDGGVYACRVIDSSIPTAKQKYQPFNVFEPTAISIFDVSTIDADCNGESTGAIFITATYGTDPLKYSINGGSSFQADPDFLDYPAGSYNVIVSDKNDCDAVWGSNPVVIGQPDPLTVDLEGIVNNDCFGTSLGEIDITTKDGNGGYSWTWNGPGGPYFTEDLTGLPAGDYDLYVEDMLGCNTTSGPHTVTEGAEIVINGITATDEQCRDDGLGSVVVDATGGTGTLTYTLYKEPGAIFADQNTDGDFQGRDSATYRVSITDTPGCGPVEQGGILVDNPMPVSIINEDTTSITCNAADNGTFTVMAQGGTAPLSYRLYREPADLVETRADGNFTDIAPDANDYYVSVTDANGCPADETARYNFAEPAAVTLDITDTNDVSCYNVNDGSIIAVGGGGSGSYQYRLDGGPPQSSGTFNGLPGGTYSVSVTDSKGCAGPTANNLVVVNPPPITIDSTRVIDIMCFGETNGEVRAYAIGGTGTLVYTLNPVAGVESPAGIFTTLPADSYDISVTDANACPPASVSNLVVNEPLPLAIDTESFTPITCNNENDGSISVTARDGTPPYTYSLYSTGGGPPLATNNDGNFTFLSPSSPEKFYVEVTDANACGPVQSSQWEFTNPAPLSIAGIDTNDITCNGANDGWLEVQASGGTRPYLFTLNPGSLSQADSVFTGLGANTYSVDVTDSRGCPQATINNLVITEPSPLSITAAKQNITCTGASDGQIVAVLSGGGTPPLKYILNKSGVPFDSNYVGNFSGLDGGTYSITVTDTNRCTPATSGSLNLVNPQPINIILEDTTSITCFGDDDGTITVRASGGTLPYDYQLYREPSDPIANDPDGDFSGITPDPANRYFVVVTDKNNCEPDTSAYWLFTEPATITLVGIDTGDVSCAGAADGSLEVKAAGGTRPYSFTLSPGGTSQPDSVFTGLSGNTYSVSVTDSRGCPPATVNNLVVNEPLPITITTIDTNDVSCFGNNDGSIVVTASGGTGTIYYTLTPGPLNNTDGNFTGLSGTISYTLSITDDNTCGPVTANNLLVTEPAQLQITGEDSSGISCFGFNDAYIDITAVGGTDTLTYILKESGTPVDTNYNDGLFQDLPPGSYTVEVDDDNGCGPEISNSFTFTEPGPVSVTVDGSSSKTLACYGDSTGTLNITVTGGYAPHTFLWTGPNGFSSTAEDISQLKAGNYNLTVTDARGCPQSYTPLDSITGPPEYTMTITKKDISCFGESNDTVWVTPSGGTAPYQYDDGFGPGPDSTFINLGPGVHIIEVIDANTCSIRDTITITMPEKLEIVGEQVIDDSQLCNGDSNGIIILTAKGGTGPLEYSIDSGNTFVANNTFNNLGGGHYYPAVRDSNACIVYKSSLIITDPAALFIKNYAQTDINTCFTSAEGEVKIRAGGGTPFPGLNPYRYVMDLTDTSLTGDFTDVMQGNHDISMLDANGCSHDTTIVISSPPPIIISTTISHVTTCYEDSTGEIGVIAAGGSGLIKGYIFSTDTTFSNDTVFYDSLRGGNYDITVIDSLGCTAITSPVVNAPDSISTDSAFAFPVSCFGSTDGEIRVYGAGGTAPYEYILLPGADTNSSGLFTSLAPGDYTVRVEDAIGCKPYVTSTLTVLEPPLLVFDSASTTVISCGGSADGSITLYASGGTAPYEYSVNDSTSYDTSAVFTSLGPGTYRLHVRDSSGCSVPGDTIVLSDPPGLSLNPTSTVDVADCAGDSTGSLTLSASGGTGALEYSLDSLVWQSSGTFNNLPAGIYTAMVRDSKTCMSLFPPDTIGEPTPITAVITTTTAEIPLPGTLTISASGGTPPLEYSIDSGKTFSADTFYLLPSEIYYVVVSDSRNCTYEKTAYVSATPPLNVNVEYMDVSCPEAGDGTITLTPLNAIPPVTYSITGGLVTQADSTFTDLIGGIYIVHVTDSQRVFRDTITVDEPAFYSVVETITQATCSRNSFDGSISLAVSGSTPPYTYLWTNDSTGSTITGLEENDYGVTITDSAGCQYTGTYTVTATVSLYADAGRDTMVCKGGSIQLNGSGGDEFTWSPEAGLDRIDLANPTATVTSDSTIYILFTRDIASGCSDRDTVMLTLHPDRNIKAGQDTTVAPGQVITLTATGGPYSLYQWDPVDGLDAPNSQTTSATVLGEITYSVTGTTEFGCVETDSMSISIATGLKIYSGFTPNGDGVNDFWDIDDIIYYPNATVKVVDRWGKTVFSSVGYADNQRWDGKYKGKDLPIGTYYYVIELKDGSEPYKGPVTIVR